MARFFNYFPKTVYTANTAVGGLDTVTNIIARFGFEQRLKTNSAAFYKYSIQDSDTPEIIAHKYYDNSERHWIVLMFNDIIDAQYDWPLRYENFINYVDKKYTANGAANTTVQTGLAWAMNINNVHSYYKIIKRTSADGTVIEEKLQIDANTYANVGATSSSITLQSGNIITQALTKEKKTYYEYEQEKNEAKRNIILLKPEFVPQVEKEFKKVIKQ
jgi:hypothetical protein